MRYNLHVLLELLRHDLDRVLHFLDRVRAITVIGGNDVEALPATVQMVVNGLLVLFDNLQQRNRDEVLRCGHSREERVHLCVRQHGGVRLERHLRDGESLCSELHKLIQVTSGNREGRAVLVSRADNGRHGFGHRRVVLGQHFSSHLQGFIAMNHGKAAAPTDLF